MTHPQNPLPGQIVFVRHAESEANAILYKSFEEHDDYNEALAEAVLLIQKHPHNSDWHLTSHGEAQAATLGRYLASRFGEHYFDDVFVSGMLRAQQTQQIAFPSATPTVDVDLNEIPRGIFEHADFRQKRTPRPRSAIKTHLVRRDGFIENLCSGAYAKKKVLIFGHGAWIASCVIYPHELMHCDIPAKDSYIANTGVVIYRSQELLPKIDADPDDTPQHLLVAVEYNAIP